MKVLVFGFYKKRNTGDNLFCEAFRLLFPNINFSFSDSITVNNIKDTSAVFFGGGSFLNSDLNISEECLNLIKTKKIFYVGVGAETAISASHKDLMSTARLIAIRSPVGLEKVKNLNNNVMVIPDLVYALTPEYKIKTQSKSVLILPNIYVVPKNTDEHWKYNSWDHFKFEFSQFVDHLIAHNYNINFAAMCNNKEENDENAAIEIINSMTNRSYDYLVDVPRKSQEIFKMFSKYDIIITQRFHGIVLAEMLKIPYISLFHHDKLNSSYLNDGAFISYYASSKQTFIDQFNYSIKKINHLPLKSDLYDNLKDHINKILSED
jgi:polysaccharide pyruvyl transferase WcaK-like protein